MSDHDSLITLNDVETIVKAEPFDVAWTYKFILWTIFIVSSLTFIHGISTGDAKQVWLSFHVNFTFWFAMAAASTIFSAVLHICNAQWARPIRRLFESASMFLFYSSIALVFLYFGRDYLFIWAVEEVKGRGSWLNPKFVYSRDVIAILILFYISGKVVFLSIKKDICAIRGGLTKINNEDLDRWFSKSYDYFCPQQVNNPTDEIEKAHLKIGFLSPIVIAVYSVVMTLIAFDQIMSVEPDWYSTLFGALFFMSGLYIGTASCALLINFVRKNHPLFFAKIRKTTLHDLGKILFGFGIFWAYMFWSHYLTIWYANMPEETGWVIKRLREQPWHDFAWMIFGLSFVVPFFLGLSRDVKQVPRLLLFTALIVMSGIWLQQYLLFIPTHFPNEIPLSLTDVTITLGFFSAYLLSAISFLGKVPLIPFGDLYIETDH